MSAWNEVIVSVGDFNQAARLWRDTFGFQTSTRPLEPRIREDLDKASSIVDEVLLRTPGHTHGGIRLVAFEQPGDAVRNGAASTDLCPKNLDIYVDDLPLRLEELRQQGWHFHSDQYSEVTAPNGVRFREIHMAGHDCINIVLLQLLDEPMKFTDRGFCGIGALVTTINDVTEEQRFYQTRLDATLAAEHRLDGPEIEAMIGLPAGAGLDIRILGAPDNLLGQMELVSYGPASTANLYPQATPPARGILAVVFSHPTASFKQLSPAGFQVFNLQAVAAGA